MSVLLLVLTEGEYILSFTVGSLFDGSGGFPLAAFMCGGVPVWASEIEPYPIAVTKTRFPYMKHLGSVTDIKDNEIEPVDVITFGSPCQDLSVAGKRAGLKHEDNGDEETTRSGLFMEAVRIIKEMREATNGVYPRFALWENVPGAFSSNKGEDFRIVLEELIKIVEPTAVMPAVPKSGWAYSDHYSGDGWSLAYRVLDAQFWGVPQRRRRIYLVLDLGGQRAGEISFKREGLRGYFEEGRAPWQGLAGDAENCSGTANRERNCVIDTNNDQYSFQPMSLRDENWSESGVKNALRAGESKSSHVIVCREDRDCVGFDAYNQSLTGSVAKPLTNSATGQGASNTRPSVMIVLDDQGGSQISVRNDGKSPTLRAEMHGNVPCVLESAGFKELNSAKARSDGYGYEVAPCLSANKHDACVAYSSESVVYNGENITHPLNKTNPQPGDPCHTLGTDSRNYLVYCLQGNGIDRSEKSGCNGRGWTEDVSHTLNTMDRPAVAFAMQGFGDYKDATDLVVKPIVLDRAFFNQGQNALYDPQFYTDGTVPTIVARGPAAVCHKAEPRYAVRRLTPTECARLQGFPDGWGHPDKKDSFTDEEYEFWLNVRNTHAEINGKAVKSYTKDQMLNWYNKLHTDSSEYKLWGNGIALPTALYFMQGIADTFK